MGPRTTIPAEKMQRKAQDALLLPGKATDGPCPASFFLYILFLIFQLHTQNSIDPCSFSFNQSLSHLQCDHSLDYGTTRVPWLAT
jgi:hypothetical protein